MLNIQDWGQKIKNVAEDLLSEWGLIAVVFLVALSSFALGRLSVLESAKPPVAISQAPTEQKQREMTAGGLIVASKSGSAYYFPWCTGAAKILPINQVWFADETSAKRAGYAPAKNCKGLQGS